MADGLHDLFVVHCWRQFRSNSWHFRRRWSYFRKIWDSSAWLKKKMYAIHIVNKNRESSIKSEACVKHDKNMKLLCCGSRIRFDKLTNLKRFSTVTFIFIRVSETFYLSWAISFLHVGLVPSDCLQKLQENLQDERWLWKTPSFKTWPASERETVDPNWGNLC